MLIKNKTNKEGILTGKCSLIAKTIIMRISIKEIIRLAIGFIRMLARITGIAHVIRLLPATISSGRSEIIITKIKKLKNSKLATKDEIYLFKIKTTIIAIKIIPEFKYKVFISGSVSPLNPVIIKIITLNKGIRIPITKRKIFNVFSFLT
jgi:hypothetical protein